MHVNAYFLQTTGKFLSRITHPTALSIGRGLGMLASYVARKHFRRIAHDIALAFPEASPAAVTALARESYSRLGMNFIEFLRLPYQSHEETRAIIKLEGQEHLDAALARGKGVVLFGGHLGNWELSGIALTMHGYRLSAVTKPQRNSAFSDLINSTREQYGITVLTMTQVREALRVLKRNECLGNISDLNARTPSVFIQFFGRPAATYTGAAFFALSTDAAVVPVHSERLPDGTHRVRLTPAIPLIRTGDRQRDQFLNTIRFHRSLEAEIRRHPEDWYWLVRRWQTQLEDVENPDTIPMEHRDLTLREVEELLAFVPQ